MLKRLSAALLIVTATKMAFAYSSNLDPNQSGSIAVTTSTSTPTQIFVQDSQATKTCVVNTSTNTVFFVGYSTTSAKSTGVNAVPSTNTTTGSFYVQGTLNGSQVLQALPFCFDGLSDAFRGPLWAVAAGGGGTVIQRLRMH